MTKNHTTKDPADAAPDMLEQFSALLLNLHHAASAQPASDFQAQALRLLNALISFDAGWWALGVDDPHAQIYDTCLHNLPLEMLDKYNELKEFDVIAQAVARQPGITLNVRIHDWYPKEYWPYLDVYGFHHALSTVTADPITGLSTGVTLYRADPQRPFSEPERRFKQALTPHLVAALNRTQIDPWTRPASSERRFPGTAIADEGGRLRYANENFGAMLQLEWPDWRGPLLPEAVRELLCAGNEARFAGSRIAAQITLRQHMPLIQLRSKRLADQLTGQQMKVANYAVDGLNFKEIARRMDLSPATVRTYLTNIYRKLGVKNKVQLAETMREVE